MSIPNFLKDFPGYGEFIIMNYALLPDSYGGGTIPGYIPGAHFFGTVTLNDSVNMKLAQAQGVKGIYRLVTSRDVKLPWHTVFQSVDGEKTYRVTTKEGNATPANAGIDLTYVDAEEYDLVDVTISG